MARWPPLPVSGRGHLEPHRGLVPPGIATGSRSMTAHPRWASAARDERIAALA
jgi:hypothetical protein